MAEVRMTMEEYLALLSGMSEMTGEQSPVSAETNLARKNKKKSSAYSRRYKANFRKVAPRFKMKSGKWKKNGFKSAVKLAHKMSKK